MSIEAMKLAAEFNRYFTSGNGVDVPERVSVSRDEWRALFTAIQQAEAQQPAPHVNEKHFSDFELLVVTTAYEQGFGHAFRDDLSNPYASGTDAYKAWDMGRSAGKRNGQPQQPATGEPVGYMNEGHIHELAMGRIPYGYVYPEAGAGASTAVYAHPAPSVLKDDQIAALVNKVRDIARMFHDHQSLRERIAIELVPALKASQDVQSNAERWIYAIADGGNQSMNFIDIFDDWDGDGDFVEVFDAAMLAAK